MLFGNDRNQMRRYFCEAWRRRRQGTPLDPLAAQVATVIEAHPEYHTLLEDEHAALELESTPESTQGNPFLHMGMHLAIHEQIATDRPAGLARAYQGLAAHLGAHEAEHRIMECLGEALWSAQRDARMPDEAAYLECVLRLIPA